LIAVRSGSTTTGSSVLALAALVVAGAAGLLGVLRAAPASAAAECVAVIVDFRQLGGSVQTRCAQGDPSSGLQSLTKAGFGYSPRPRDGLVCQLDATPACSATTSSTYWSYWYRVRGSGTWVYANEGPGTHDPKPGSTEAWVWQDGGRTEPPNIAAATICPQLTAAPEPTRTKPSPEASRPAGGSKKPSTSTARTTGGPDRPATVSPKPSATATVTPSAAVAATPTPTLSPTSSSPSVESPAAAIDPEPTGGSGSALAGGAGLVLGSSLVLGIGTAAALRARRNRAS
jgi:hypothetical protein